MKQETLRLDLTTGAFAPPVLPEGHTFSSLTSHSAQELGRLYFECFERSDVPTIEYANSEMEKTLRGDYGAFCPAYSCAVVCGERLRGAVFVVKDAPWEGVSPGLFVSDFMVAPEHRGKGIGRFLLVWAIQAARRDGHTSMALRVDPANRAALSLYRKLGFRDAAASRL